MAQAFEAFPPGVRRSLLRLRELIFKTAASTLHSFRTLFPDDFSFEGNRALVFDEAEAMPTEALAYCIAAALSYHRSGGLMKAQR